jgi:hypothetical protein
MDWRRLFGLLRTDFFTGSPLAIEGRMWVRLGAHQPR